MSDTTDDMECDAARLCCSTCEEHHEDCECDEDEKLLYIYNGWN